METIGIHLKRIATYVQTLAKWIAASSLTGIICGIIGALFHKCVEYATDFRIQNPWMILLLPLAGILIVFIYQKTKMLENGGTNNVIESVRTNAYVPMRLAPVIFITTVITHLFGGSAGREGAALQLGGSIGFQIGRRLKIDEKDKRMLVICGMSGLFSALFGTPLTAAVFSIEVISVGVLYYAGFLPGLTSAAIAYAVSLLLGSEPTRFAINFIPDITVINVLKVSLIGLAAAFASIAFCISLKLCSKFFKSKFKNPYMRPFAGGIIIIILTFIVGNTDYNGSGMNIINSAVLDGSTVWFAFILKIIFTAVTIGSGFRGGEIVPTMFIGSTLGCELSSLINLNPSFGAAIGISAMFCGVANCPMASLMLSIELFGGNGILFFAAAIAVSYVMSGYYGLYSSQKIIYSKLHIKYVNRDIN